MGSSNEITKSKSFSSIFIYKINYLHILHYRSYQNSIKYHTLLNRNKNILILYMVTFFLTSESNQNIFINRNSESKI